jgi:GntR family transcriptional repressor for pyruvate dehydrogenase complex
LEQKRNRLKKTYEQVADHIKRLIEQGTLTPGQKLPPMSELAVRFGVSRATVREAFSALVGMGLIDLRHGEGTFVRRLDVQTMIVEPMNAALLLGMGELVELLEVRCLLETGTARLACERATDEQIAMAEAVLDTSHDDPADRDLQFHLWLAESAGNTVLFNLMNTLSEPLRSLLREIHAEPAVSSELDREHREILQAICERDGKRAVQLIADHLAHTEQRLRNMRFTM